MNATTSEVNGTLSALLFEDEDLILSNESLSLEEESGMEAETTEEYINSLITFYGEGIILTAVSTFGLIGNLMSIVVLTRSINSRSFAGGSSRASSGGNSFSNLLRGLATFDALFLVVAIMSFGLPKMSQFYVKHVFQHIMAIVYGLLHTFRVGSVYVTLAVTFERFHAIICPLRHFKRKKYMLPACIFIAVVYNIPKYFELQIVHDPMPRVASTAMRENQVYVSLYLFWSKFIFIEVIPYTIILIMNIFIIIKITKSARFRKKFQRQGTEDDYEAEIVDVHPAAASTRPRGSSSNNSNGEAENDLIETNSRGADEGKLGQLRNAATKSSGQHRLHHMSSGLIKSLVRQRPRRTFTKKQMEEHNLGMILIAMSSLFIFCQSFKIIPDLYELIQCNRLGTLGHNCDMKGPAINAILRLSHLLVCVNSSANFLIYYARGEKFRLAWIETFGQCWCRCFKKPASAADIPMRGRNGSTCHTVVGDLHLTTTSRKQQEMIALTDTSPQDSVKIERRESLHTNNAATLL